MRIGWIGLAMAIWVLPTAVATAQNSDDRCVREAIERALPPIQLALETFNDNKPTIKQFPSCVACHHEGIGLTTLAVLRKHGFAVDRELERTEARSLRDFFERTREANVAALDGGAEARKKADPFGDFSAGVGYLVGALVDHGKPHNDSIDAVTLLLIKDQRDDGRWTFHTQRVPTQSSDFTTTAMAVRILRSYSVPGHANDAERAVSRAREWLLNHAPETNDDKAFRLLGLRWAGAPAEAVAAAAQNLKRDQRSDGGWAQLADPAMGSDAYGTGLALFALREGSSLPAADPVYQRGVSYLLATQKDDGTWYVAKRATAYQRYFDAGFPYEKDQYISLPATCWAVMALAIGTESASKDAPRQVSRAGLGR